MLKIIRDNDPAKTLLWPEDYVSRIEKGKYTAPVAGSTLMERRKLEDCVTVLTSGKMEIEVVKPRHDPVWLILQDFCFLQIEGDSVQWIREFLALMGQLLLMDHRGIISGRSNSITILLKNVTDLIDIESYLVKIDNMDKQIKALQSQLDDRDLQALRSRNDAACNVQTGRK